MFWILSYIWNTIYNNVSLLFYSTDKMIETGKKQLYSIYSKNNKHTQIISPQVYNAVKLYHIRPNNLLKRTNCIKSNTKINNDTINNSINNRINNSINNDINSDITNEKIKKIKIVSWNIHYGLDIFMKHTLQEIGYYLSKLNADIICLQEISSNYILIQQTGLINQITYLAAYLGYHFYYFNDLAVLSRFPVKLELEKYYLSQSNFSNFKTRFLKVSIHITLTHIINIYNCHLPNDLTGYGQNEGLIQSGLYAHILTDTYNKKPIIVCGDFNCHSMFSAIKKVKKITSSGKLKTATYPNIYPFFQLDHIMTNGEWLNNYKITNEYIDYNCHLSDHHPIISEITLHK